MTDYTNEELAEQLEQELNWNMGTLADMGCYEIIRQAASRLRSMSWNFNMDEAPRDGTEILVYSIGANECFVSFWEGSGWQFAYDGLNDVVVGLAGVDAWIHLPSPPEKT